MDVVGFHGRISGHFEAFLVIFCLCILNQMDIRLFFSLNISTVYFIFQERLLENILVVSGW